MRSLDERLREQNNGQSWRPCEYTARGRRRLALGRPAHDLGPAEVLASGSEVRKCRRCPVSILTVAREPWCNHDAVAVVDGVCECGEAL